MKKTEEFNNEIKKKFLNSDQFAQVIEKIVLSHSEYNYIDAILEYCETNSIEPELISKIIPNTLKQKLKKDAIRLNYIKSTPKAKLPM